MRPFLATIMAVVAVTTPLSAQGDANRHQTQVHATNAPPRRGRPAAAPQQSAQRGANQHQSQVHAPNAPSRRGRPDAAPQWEPGREGAAVPYVRGDHWYGNAAPNDRRFRLDRPFTHGRFADVGPSHVYSVLRIDLGAHEVWLPGGYAFGIAPWEWSLTGSWCWDCGDQFVVYDDPDHLGWYLLLDVRTGEYVHVQYLGV